MPPATAINLKPKAQLTDILYKMVPCVQVILNTRLKSCALYTSFRPKQIRLERLCVVHNNHVIFRWFLLVVCVD